MTGRSQTLMGLLLCLVCFAAGWWVCGQRATAQISLLKQEHAEQVNRAGASVLATYTKMEKTKDEAIKLAQARATALEADAGRASAAADSLRKQLASVPARVAAASRTAVDEYAATATVVFQQCSARYAAMAAAADGHANDAATCRAAWPMNLPSE